MPKKMSRMITTRSFPGYGATFQEGGVHRTDAIVIKMDAQIQLYDETSLIQVEHTQPKNVLKSQSHVWTLPIGLPFEDIEAVFDTRSTYAYEQRHNIAPTQTIPFIRQMLGQRVMDSGRWGLIPPWSKDGLKTKPLINARSETASQEPSFRDALHQGRCLVLRRAFTNGDGRAAPKHLISFDTKNNRSSRRNWPSLERPRRSDEHHSYFDCGSRRSTG